ncbi:MAG: adenine phosphoribosyltransferase [Actinomycetota bacterium]|nr:adenine phosphoribosyltransferase [Actinomycetota bacterium]
MKADPERLKQKIRSIPDFPRPGVDFKDITPLLADAESYVPVVDAMVDRYRDRRVDKVCGIEARGFILAAPVAYRLGVGFVPIRKHGKLPYLSEAAAYTLEYSEEILEIHSDAVASGDRVLIVDDVLATGGTASASAELVQRLGGVVAGICCLIELEFLGGRAKVEEFDFYSLVRY